MPLPPPTAPRKHLHTRVVQCQGYQRDDGLWDVEAHMTDTKTTPVHLTERGQVETGVPIHDMWLRITVTDELLIVKAEAAMDYTPFQSCPAIASAYQKLEGLQIGPGFTRKTRDLFRGTNGCTHLLELIGPLATTAYQTLFGGGPLSEQGRRQPAEGDTPPMLNSCYGFRSDGAAVKRNWPEFYTGD